MTTYRLLLVAALAALPSVASAKVVFCNASGRSAPGTIYYTPFVDIGLSESASGDLGDAFEAYLNSTHPEGDSWDATCDVESSLHGSQSRLSWFKYNNREYRWIPTDFTGGFPKATDASSDSEESGAYLTVKTEAGLADAAAARDAAILQAQRDEAAALAQRVANTARAQAENQALLAKYFEEMRKRGSAQ